MVDSAQLSAHKLAKLFAALAVTACLVAFNSSNAIAQSGHVHYGKTTTHKGPSPLVAPTATGSRVYWFAISTNGYGSAPFSMIPSSATGAQTDAAGNVYVLTDSQGNFSISAANSCPTTDSFMYFLISGGEVGTAPNNPAIAMMAVIPVICGSPNFFVDISETTTIAAAYALGSFATFSTDSFATNSNSISALQSAVAYSSTLINTANAVIPNGSAWQTTLNTLGDMIEACINSASACSTLFAAATPPGGTAPTDTFQAALNIALNPSLNLTTLFDAIPSSPDFTPILSAVPASWTLPGSSIQITGVTPDPAPVGASITIVGSGFGASQGNGVVVIGGVQASVSSWSDKSIVVTIPSGAASSGVAQVFANSSASNQFPYSIGPLITPSISGLSFSQGPVGMGFVITGANFGPVQGTSTVTMGGNPIQGILTILSWSPTGDSITVQIPSTITSGGDVVVTVGGLPSNGVNFTLAAPFGCSPQ